jgi:Cytochrome P460
MKRIAFWLVAVATVVSVIASTAPAAGRADEDATPIFGIQIFPGYRDWRLISVAHEAGNVNDIRAILGNDVAIKAYREGKWPFPDGTVIARIAWTKIPSQEKQQSLWPRATAHCCSSSLWRTRLSRLRPNGVGIRRCGTVCL